MTSGSVTVQLGANDLFALLQSPAFSAPGADQFALLKQALQTFAINEGTVLGELRAALPSAKILVLDYYNPYPGSGSPFEPAAIQGIPALNYTIQQVAAGVPGATFVDIYPQFVGNEAAYTHIRDDATYNVHPTPAGYAVIANAIDAAVPEPGSCALLAVGGAITVLMARRRRAA